MRPVLLRRPSQHHKSGETLCRSCRQGPRTFIMLSAESRHRVHSLSSSIAQRRQACDLRAKILYAPCPRVRWQRRPATRRALVLGPIHAPTRDHRIESDRGCSSYDLAAARLFAPTAPSLGKLSLQASCPRSPCTQASPSDFSSSCALLLDADICRQSEDLRCGDTDRHVSTRPTNSHAKIRSRPIGDAERDDSLGN